MNMIIFDPKCIEAAAKQFTNYVKNINTAHNNHRANNDDDGRTLLNNVLYFYRVEVECILNERWGHRIYHKLEY